MSADPATILVQPQRCAAATRRGRRRPAVPTWPRTVLRTSRAPGQCPDAPEIHPFSRGSNTVTRNIGIQIHHGDTKARRLSGAPTSLPDRLEDANGPRLPTEVSGSKN